MFSNVGKLTNNGKSRRLADAGQPYRRLLPLLFGMLMSMLAIIIASPANAGDQTQWHPTGDIAATAEAFLRERLGTSSGSSSVKAGMLDGRLRLANCELPLEGFLRPGTKISPKTIVGVRCTGNRPWNLYVPVEVTVEKSILVARQPLPRGHLLSPADLSVDIRDVSRMRSGYVVDEKVVLGQRLRSSILAGQAITLQLIEADKVVQRGQTVTLIVSAGGISIRMTGKALSDGAISQRIRVENLNSGRIVEGIVRSTEIVEVLVPVASNYLSH